MRDYTRRVFRGRRVIVVIPCYEVGAHIGGVVRALPGLVDVVVIVDDGSRDDPGSIARAADPSRVVVINHSRNEGLARAMTSGFRAALELGADVVVKVDGDGQMDPLEMPRLLAPVVAGHADIAKGNRFLSRRHLGGMPLLRLGGNLVLSFLTKLASGYWNVFDPTNGYLAIRRQVLEEIDLDCLGPRYFFETSLLCQAFLAGAVVRDVSMPARYRNERSSLSMRRTLVEFPALLIRAFIRRVTFQHFVRDFTPVALFLLAGATTLGVSLIYGYSTWNASAELRQATPPGTIALIGLGVLAGFQLLVQAAVLDIASVPSRSPWPTVDPDDGPAVADPTARPPAAGGVPRDRHLPRPGLPP
jgi:glycosyltransferase involved in cell wall biosynthesis